MKMVHRDCGGEIYESETEGYIYCSLHSGDCQPPGCGRETLIPALFCRDCGYEIGGDAEIEFKEEE